MKYAPAIHQRQSIRLRNFDYSANGAYFVTVCAHGRQCLLGDIRDGVMELNDAGRMVETIWQTLPERYPHIELVEFVVMPNHFHGIIMLNNHRGEPRVCPPLKYQTSIQNQGEHKVRPYGFRRDVSRGIRVRCLLLN